jgi:uncharacterized membrane protein YhhN
MNPWLFSLVAGAILLGGAHLWTRTHGQEQAARRLKALPVALALLVVLTAGTLLPPSVTPTYRWLVAAGLLFSMAGDIFLALPKDRFVAGLGSFLIAHLFYIGAFVARAGFQGAPIALLLALGYGALMLALLLPHVQGVLRVAVALYMGVILVMGWQAAGLWLAIGDRAAALALAGALFFVASDSVLAWDRFRRPFAAAPLVVMVTYYIAQWLLALSVIDWGI